MFDITPQERLALLVIAALILAGAVGRHVANAGEAGSALNFAASPADTLSTGSAPGLRAQVAGELASERAWSRPLAEGEKIDPNTASAAELDRLPGIGPAIAERIVQRRREVGRFGALEEMATVRGIGPAALERIGPHLVFPASGRAGARRDSRIDLNRASAAELDALPGIGPAIAERIVRYRADNGPFGEWKDLENVTGIGPRLRERLQGVARLGP